MLEVTEENLAQLKLKFKSAFRKVGRISCCMFMIMSKPVIRLSKGAISRRDSFISARFTSEAVVDLDLPVPCH
jgi:hypothetical protein